MSVDYASNLQGFLFPLCPFRVNPRDRQFSLPFLGGGGKAVDLFVVHPDTKGAVFWGPSFKQWWLGLDIDFSFCVHLNQYIHSFGKCPQAKDSLGFAYFLGSYLHSILGLQVCVVFFFFSLCCKHRMHFKRLKNTLSTIFSCFNEKIILNI